MTSSRKKSSGVTAANEEPTPDNFNKGIHYNSFMLDQEKYTTGEGVFVQSESGDDWVAEIVEIRAQDTRNVFIEVKWYYKPEEVKGGRKSYHGENEVFKSNHHDYIHVGSINGKATVLHYDESDPSALESPDFYWRQEYDYTKHQIKGNLKLLACCKKPANPDEKNITCPKCYEYFHAACVSTKKRKSKKEEPRPSKRKAADALQSKSKDSETTNGVGDQSVHGESGMHSEINKCPKCGETLLT